MCQDVVQALLEERWEQYGGYRGVEFTATPDREAQDALTYLGDVVAHSRAPVTEKSDDGVERTTLEDSRRLINTLRHIAEGRALLNGRTEIEIDDIAVCARIALSTMPKERRPVVRAVLNPDNGDRLSTSELVEQTPFSRPTVLDRMKVLDTLGIVDHKEADDSKTQFVERRDEFEWPDSLAFPEF